MVAMEGSATSSPERSEHEAEGTLHRLASLKAQPGSHHHFSDAEVRVPLLLPCYGVCRGWHGSLESR